VQLVSIEGRRLPAVSSMFGDRKCCREIAQR